MASLLVDYTVNFGANVRIGYRQYNTSSPFTYLSYYPTYNDSPVLIDGLPIGIYEVEITTICPNCSGGIFSEPEIVQAQSF